MSLGLIFISLYVDSDLSRIFSHNEVSDILHMKSLADLRILNIKLGIIFEILYL